MDVKFEEKLQNQSCGYSLKVSFPNTNERKSTERLGTGNSHLVFDILPEEEEKMIFESLNSEMQWGEMSHKGGLVPRLVCNQGTIYTNKESENMKSFFRPIYRHPAANPPPLIPWTPHVDEIRKISEEICGHPLNHALIQLYRSGDDYISEHADKTLDIKEGSYICNYSCGAKRTMIFRWKKEARENDKAAVCNVDLKANQKPEDLAVIKQQQEAQNKIKNEKQNARVPMAHNSLFLLDPHTNRHMLHSIKRDKRPVCEKTEEELKEEGARISITFRWIHSFERISDGMLFGGGSRRKNIQVNEDDSTIWLEANENNAEGIMYVSNENSSSQNVIEDGNKMLFGFSQENSHAKAFNWSAVYGSGFDAKEAPNFV